MPSRSKTKGDSFERAIAKRLTDAFGEPFIRSAGSGAWRGGKNASRMAPEAAIRDRTGDITCPEGIPLVIECKRYKDIPDLFESTALIDGWLDQLLEGVGEGDVGLLVCQGDRKSPMAAVPCRVGAHSPSGAHYLVYRHRDTNWAFLRLDAAIEGLVSKFKTPLRTALQEFEPPDGKAPKKPMGLTSRKIPKDLSEKRGGGFRPGYRSEDA